MVTTQQIQIKLNEAKKDPIVARELQKRLETGIYDSQLTELGLTRTPQGLRPIKDTRVVGDIGQDFRQIGTDILESSRRRVGNIQEIQSALKSGEQGNLRSIGQTVGQVAGAGADAIGASFKGVANMALPQTTEEQITSKVSGAVQQTKLPEVIERYEQLKQTNPALARDIDSVLGIASLGAEFLGLDVAKRGTGLAVDTAKTGARQVANTVEDVAGATAKTVRSVVPESERVVNYQVTRALDLTQGDVKNIATATSNEPALWVADNNLIRDTKEATQEAIKQFGDENYTAVRNEIGKITKGYVPTEVPRYQDAITQILKETEGVVGFEDVANEAKSLLGKETLTLQDIQRTKELMDDVFNLYKVTGTVKETTAKKGLSNVRKDLRQFIEDEVKMETGVDIQPLNNNVATARSLEKAIVERSTRGLTRSNLKLGDLAVFGLGSTTTTPLGGVALVIAKKIAESPTVRLRFAKWLDSVSDAKKIKIEKSLNEGIVPEELQKIVNQSDDLASNSIKNTTQKTSISKTIPQEESFSNPTVGKTVKNTIKKALNDERGFIASSFKDDLTTSISKAKASGQSFNEWVKGQGETYYHGAKTDFDVFDKSKIKQAQFGQGLYATDIKDVAQKYGETVKEYIGSNKFATLDDLGGEIGYVKLARQLYEKKFGKKFSPSKGMLKSGFDDFYYLKEVDSPKNIEAKNLVIEHLKDKGFTGLKLKQIGDDTTYLIFDPSKLKTRSQLKAEWDKVGTAYSGEKDLTTKILKDLEGKTTVSKQYILDATNRGELKQVERDLIRDLVSREGDTVNVADFAKKVTAELLPLERNSSENFRVKIKELEKKINTKGFTVDEDLDGSVFLTDKNGDYVDYDELPNDVQKMLDIYGSLAKDGQGKPKQVGFENISLPDELRGNVANYAEIIYESPIKTSAGSTHFPARNAKGYFGHTRIEDMADNKTRRVIEVQSDLYQKGNLEKMVKEDYSSIRALSESEHKEYLGLAGKMSNYKIGSPEYIPLKKRFEELKAKSVSEMGKNIKPLQQYNDPTAHFRMIREEIKKASQDGKTKLQFPTGETAMKIEGLGENARWTDISDYIDGDEAVIAGEGQLLRSQDLKVGQRVSRVDNDDFGTFDPDDSWIITDVLGDGKFKAVPKGESEIDIAEYIKENDGALPSGMGYLEETFDISSKVDTNNPIYKFYEKDVQKYLSKFGGKKVVDENGVSWIEVPIKKEWGNMPVEAFGKIKVSPLVAGAGVGTAGVMVAGAVMNKKKK